MLVSTSDLTVLKVNIAAILEDKITPILIESSSKYGFVLILGEMNNLQSQLA
jgi:hypothetical protein